MQMLYPNSPILGAAGEGKAPGSLEEVCDGHQQSRHSQRAGERGFGNGAN